MLAICTKCQCAQDIEKAGSVCWACGTEMSDAERIHVGERGELDPVGNSHFGEN